MILKVARLGFPSVRTAARPVDPAQIKTHDFQKVIDDMVDTMHEYVGVGLAAPQVHLPIQLAVLEVENHPRYPDMPDVPLTVLINPAVTIADRTLVEDWEGCLSIPDMRGRVPRYAKLKVDCLDRFGKRQEFVADGFFARVVQHEFDHLMGNVYIDRMPNFSTLTHFAEFGRYWMPAPPQPK